MVPRICAVWLVALILAPFSAPFSVGEVSPSLKNATSHALPVARSPLRAKRVIDNAARTHVSPPGASAALDARPRSPAPFCNTPLVLQLRI
jgi:hypothetical protein